jgi:hypothetical protein
MDLDMYLIVRWWCVDGNWKGEISQARILVDALPDRLANPSNRATVPGGGFRVQSPGILEG